MTTCRGLVGSWKSSTPATRLPKAVADCLCTAARELRRGKTESTLIPAPLARRLDPAGLLALAGRFDSAGSPHEPPPDRDHQVNRPRQSEAGNRITASRQDPVFTDRHGAPELITPRGIR